MAFDFPASPTEGQVYVSGGVSYTFRNGVWTTSGQVPPDTGYVLKAGDTMSGGLTAPAFSASGNITGANITASGILLASHPLSLIRKQYIGTSGAIALYADTKAFLVELQGGGANGGPGNAAAAACASASAGGGSGAYCVAWVTRLPGHSISCVIGAATVLGGAANGNASVFTDITNGTSMTANGGLVGGTGLNTQLAYTIQGGEGGTASGNMTNAFYFNGKRGGWSWAYGYTGGGTGRGGAGADSLFGSGGFGSYYGGAGSNQHGQSAWGYGAGGGGGYAVNNYGSYGGGGGGQGLVVITEFR